jgi:hypothetical protein
MQDFHADCIINILLQAQGKPAKYAWICSLSTRNSVRLVWARKFMGLVNREEAEWAAALFGLEQAQRLQQEKVQFSAGFSAPDPRAGKLRDPRIQSMKARAEKIWESFRLKKEGRISAEEETFLRDEVGKVFFQNRRRRDG